MKRKKEKAPGFDDIIFRDRNKEYGAYDLRKRYSSTMSISIVAGLICGISMVLIPYFRTDRTIVPPGLIIDYTPLSPVPIDQKTEQPPESPKIPKDIINVAKFMAPDIVDKTSDARGEIATADQGLDNSSDQPPEDIEIISADPEPIVPVEEPPFVNPEEMPSFPGGEVEMMKFIYSNIVYPSDAIANGIQGTVILRFVVSPTGEVTKIELLRSINPLLDNEAIRILSMMPSWRPGKQGGRPVPVYFTVPVTFKLNGY